MITPSIKNQLENIVLGLKENYQAELILLFGSLAKESFSEGSDVDLLVVKETKKRPIWRRVEARKAFQSDLPIDILVYTPQEFYEFKKDTHSFLNRILKESKVLYEKKI